MKKFWLGQLNTNQTVNIIGAGFSGLLAGLTLKKRGIAFQVYESTSNIGGKLSSINSQHGIIEPAANALLLTPKVQSFLEELNLPFIKSSKKIKRFILRSGKLKTFPFLNGNELLKTFNLLKKTPGKNDLSVYDFFNPLLGSSTNEIITPILQGIYATPCQNLDFSLIFNQNFDFGTTSYLTYFRNLIKKSEAIKSISFQNGMSSLTQKMYEKIKENVQLNSQIDELPENALLCIPPHLAYSLTKDKTLKDIKMLNIFSKTIILKEPIKKLSKSFGCLFPKNDIGLMGVLCNHQIFKFNHSPSYTFISNQSLTNESIIDFFQKEKILKDMKILETYDFPWKQGIPEYSKSLKKVVSNLESSQHAYFSNYTGSISLRSLIEKTVP